MPNMKYYCYCPVCKDFAKGASSLSDAKDKITLHEKECHKGKPLGTFGTGKTYPKGNVCPNCYGSGQDGSWEDIFECGHCNGKGHLWDE